MLSVDRGIKTANFSMLAGTLNMPSMLVECGFMTSQLDAALLSSYEGRESVALAIADTIQNFEIHGGL
jgi:N-acetylmuramoyl-L-alanine amidase